MLIGKCRVNHALHIQGHLSRVLEEIPGAVFINQSLGGEGYGRAQASQILLFSSSHASEP
jgi:hypothetical protein